MFSSLCPFDIGLHLDDSAAGVRLTLDSLARAGWGGRVLILAPPEVDVPPGLEGPTVEVVRTARRGGATAFNALLQASAADLVVFMESGVQVTPGALERLVRALAPVLGLAGPSTNLSWNEQRQPDAPPAHAPAEALTDYAALLAQRHGDAVRELLPLHSLADFLLMVRRQPVLALGGADEAYDPGPCWEMDLNVRAHRAGWRGVWVPGSYVHRTPPQASHREREAYFFPDNRRRFQERFCGRLLRGEKSEYSAHCLGEACSDFAPAHLLHPILARGPGGRLVQPSAVALAGSPLVSCILPTADRPGFVAEAVRNFLGQDYARRELLVVDDGEPPIAGLLPRDERIRYFRLRERLTVGEKRNFACQQARGPLIAHLDDDDWYPPDRLSRQVRALLASEALVCGTSSLYFIDPLTEAAWRYGYPGAGWVAGSSLVYRRSFWERHRFLPIQVAEDWHFLRRLPDARTLLDLDDPDLCVATVHPGNTSAKRREPPYWQSIDAGPVVLRLGSRAGAYRDAARGLLPALPRASCIMPTRGRAELVQLSLQKFQAQDYPNKELIIVDDGPWAVGWLAEGQPAVRYHRLERNEISIGEKRNIACALAAGEIICLWDDDDWYSPGRLRCQVLPIFYDQADLTGLRCDHVLCLPGGEVWRIRDDVHRLMFESDVAGGTLAFRRSIFDHVRFPHISLAEDAALIRNARARGCRLQAIGDHGVFAYVRHTRNSWRFPAGRFHDAGAWTRAAPPPELSPEALAAHQEACRLWLDQQA